MDRLEAMSTFLTVVEQGSLSAAARRLKTPLTTISRNVSELEAHLRTKLFNRSSRQLVLTDAGTSYVAACKRILTDVLEAERTASGEYTTPTGELAVTTPLGLGRIILLPIIADFLKTYPDIKVRMIPTDQKLSLAQEQIDVAVRMGELPDSSLVALRLGRTRRVVCASPAYLAARGTPRTPEDLVEHDCISYPGFSPPDVWTFLKGNATIAAPVHTRLIVGSAEAKMAIAQTTKVFNGQRKISFNDGSRAIAHGSNSGRLAVFALVIMAAAKIEVKRSRGDLEILARSAKSTAASANGAPNRSLPMLPACSRKQ